ncbi:alpha/beta hydrolase fold domain-containing protein [Rufibacter sediminis]|uniref:Alpha/beta hydrolase fold domain-containing protein n=1 Tax=Rufibacter sediminis TaxID=2762756 RepID=A0ABR6VVF1_9BACT|nr:alpha/beta hydrolase fold domain-containing protein [Rufibacter sediminis]MBC3541136.1 alpha/beta hydrolase fold domain-containing protein [Rufibacter sediminis]
MKKVLLPMIIFLLGMVPFAHAQKYKTLVYYQDDTLQLELDLFLPQKPGKQKLPLVLFEHGGGFSGGERSSGHSFGTYLANNGYAAASLTYTLYMKGKNYGCNGQLPEKIKAFQYAANHFWLATAFFLQNTEKFNLDPAKIFLAGSSAGAEAALHAAYWNYSTMNLYPKTLLPANFKYKGVISGAGALMDLNLISSTNMVPTLLFHGNADPVVPYGTAAHHYCATNSSNWLMLFGSYSIYRHLVELNGNTRLITYCGGGHEYSGELFLRNHQILVDFLNDVLAGKKTQEHVIIATGKTNERSKAYSFCE